MTSAPPTAALTCAPCAPRCAIPAPRWRWSALLLVAVPVAYGKFGRGVEFFPNVEPDFGQVIVHGRGNIALEEKNRVIAEVEKRVLDTKGLSTVYTRVGEQPRGSSEISEDTIGVIQFEFSDWKTRPTAHEIMNDIRNATADIPGVLVEVAAPRAGPPTGKAVQVQIGALESGAGARRREEGRRHRRQASRRPRHGRRPAAARHRLEDRGQPGRGREIRREPEHGRHRDPARHQRRQGHRVSADRQRQGGRHPGALPGGQAQPRPDRRAAHADAGGLRAARQLRRARRDAARRLHQPRRRQPRHDGVGQRCAGRADRQGAGGHRRRTGQDRSRPGRDLAAQGRGRGARQGLGLPAQGVRHRDLPDLCDPAGAVQPADLGRSWCSPP